jgi:hypothetical protein
METAELNSRRSDSFLEGKIFAEKVYTAGRPGDRLGNGADTLAAAFDPDSQQL